jgi:RNA polymerase sigma-70 factor (ECF subfamily)
MKNQLSDNELIMGYRNGNYSDFETLLERHQNKVYGYIFSVVKDKDVADDIFQDTFFKVIYTINSGLYKDENKFIHWVMRIAHNLIVDHFRRVNKMPMVSNNRENGDVMETLRVQEENIEKKMIQTQMQRDIRKLIKMLPDEQRRVVIMRHYGKYDFKEIAAKTGVSINTALGRMRYAIINLRRLAKETNVIIDL